MPYIFGILVVLNGLLLGYYIFFPHTQDIATLEQTKNQLVQPMEFTNSTEHVPPLIGTKR